MSAFGEKLKRMRKEKGWSQDQFAQRVGIHGRHVGKYEIGKAMPNADTVVKIAKVLGVSTDYLLIDDTHTSQGAEIRDKTLLKEFEAVDKMDETDKEVIKQLIEAFIKKNQMEALING